ncbi:hypothetical protein IJG79_00040 [Candidatus Saccharibacteria bacterium]|nr:hypothetical protein [Candidatus Saccharibacteria bacterium]
MGNKNLLILGIISVGIAIITTTVSLVIYHNSGDIYLDRSRPGYLPDESEAQPKIESNYSFGTSGQINLEVLDEYIKYYEENVDMIDDLEAPFSNTPLSDEALGIPSGE